MKQTHWLKGGEHTFGENDITQDYKITMHTYNRFLSLSYGIKLRSTRLNHIIQRILLGEGIGFWIQKAKF